MMIVFLFLTSVQIYESQCVWCPDMALLRQWAVNTNERKHMTGHVTLSRVARTEKMGWKTPQLLTTQTGLCVMSLL